MQRLFVILAVSVLLAIQQTHAQGSDDQYVLIYNQIQEAEQLENVGQANQALAKYLEAQTALQRFQKAHPEWNPPVVRFRLSDLDAKVTKLSGKAAAPAVIPPSVQAPAKTPARPEMENQINFYN